MKVSVVPFAVHDHKICSIYKLEMVLYTPENYPKNTDISLEDWEETLEVVFVRELEDAIQNHLLLLSKISGIKNFMPDSQSHASNGTDDDDVSGNRLQREEENDDDDDDDADGGGVSEDMGSDAQKRKQQSTDEMDYDDASEEEPNEGELSAGSESEIDLVEDEIEVGKDDAIRLLDAKDISYETSGLEKSSKHKSKDKKNVSEAKKKKRARAKLVKKEYDRAYFVKAKGMHFEVHFRFTNEPHILLAQVLSPSLSFFFFQFRNTIYLIKFFSAFFFFLGGGGGGGDFRVLSVHITLYYYSLSCIDFSPFPFSLLSLLPLLKIILTRSFTFPNHLYCTSPLIIFYTGVMLKT
jgi:DNA-directed RNA polymerase I subunit RPA1